MPHPALALALLLLGSRSLFPASDTLPSCAVLLDGLAHKIEANYAGFLLETRGAARETYERKRAALSVRAARAVGDACYVVLRDLTDHFRDPHLFVFQRTYLDSAEVQRRVAEFRPDRIDLDQEMMRARLARRRTVDPIEGVWRDGGMRLFVVPAPNEPPGHFVAVVIDSDTATWRPGDVRARFTHRTDGAGEDEYDGVVLERNLARRVTRAHVHKRLLLRLDPGMWGKEYPIAASDSGVVDPVDAHRATLTWRGETPVISIPSHDPTYRGALDTLLAANREALRSAPRLVIDVRGNEGGSSWVTRDLVDLIASRPPRALPDDAGEAQMLSSEDQITYVRSRWRNVARDSAAAERLAARMLSHPGALVPMEDSIDRAAAASVAPTDVAEPNEQADTSRVAILVDRGTVSAAEAFLQQAKRSARVTTFGEPTAGALDYQSVSIVRIGDTGRRWFLGYPTITARADLPRGGMRGKGISPDVRVDWRRHADPVAYVIRLLEGSAAQHGKAAPSRQP